MPANKIALIQVWFGKLPAYFEYHHQTCLTQKIDFFFFTDQEIDPKFFAPNIQFVKMTLEEYHKKLSDRTGKNLVISFPYKLNDTKPAYPDLFQDYVSEYEFVGWYDIDTLLGDVTSWIDPFLKEYDVISFGEDGPIYDRISGPLVITRNIDTVRTVYLSDPAFYDCMARVGYDEYDERKITKTYRDLGIRVKVLFNSSNADPQSLRIKFDAVWSGGKVIVEGEEKMIYHFYRKKDTAFEKKGNAIVARRKMEYIDDFYYVTYFTKSYEEMARSFISAMSKYSRRRCILYTVNYNSTLAHELSDQFIVRRLDIFSDGDFLDNRGRSFNTLTSKPLIQLDSIKAFPGKKFVFLDTDIYVTVSIDSISKYFQQLENYPLTNSHVHDTVYSIESDGELVSSLHSLGEELGVEVTVFPRRKANVMLYDSRSEWFFKEQMKIWQDHKHSKKRAIFKFHDEDTFNIILSKYNLPKSLPVVDIEESDTIDLTVYDNYTYTYKGCSVSEHAVMPERDRDVYVFHGCKNFEMFKQIDDAYGHSVLNCNDILVGYDGKDVEITKNSFLLDKNISSDVNVSLKLGDAEIFWCNWQIFSSQVFFIWDISLENHTTYLVELTESSSGRLIFRTELITNF